MILISHRGNLNGPNPLEENKPSYIIDALDKGYNVEIDVWYTSGKFMLGHDNPQYEFSFDLLKNFYTKLWLHCKNIEAIINLKQNFQLHSVLNYFWHENDIITLTSKGYIWTHSSAPFIPNSIAVMPELNNIDTTNYLGVCSDYITRYE